MYKKGVFIFISYCKSANFMTALVFKETKELEIMGSWISDNPYLANFCVVALKGVCGVTHKPTCQVFALLICRLLRISGLNSGTLIFPGAASQWKQTFSGFLNSDPLLIYLNIKNFNSLIYSDRRKQLPPKWPVYNEKHTSSRIGKNSR